MSICLDLQPDRLGQVTFAPSSSGNAGRIRTETDLVEGFTWGPSGKESEGFISQGIKVAPSSRWCQAATGLHQVSAVDWTFIPGSSSHRVRRCVKLQLERLCLFLATTLADRPSAPMD